MRKTLIAIDPDELNYLAPNKTLPSFNGKPAVFLSQLIHIVKSRAMTHFWIHIARNAEIENRMMWQPLPCNQVLV